MNGLDYGRRMTFVHQFSVDSEHYVIDGNSAVCFRIDEVAAAVLALRRAGQTRDAIRSQLASRHAGPALEGALAEVEGLFAARELDSPDPFSDTAPEQVPPVTTLCLVVSQDCNLRCGYCYADGGTYREEPQVMSLATVERAVDFLFAQSGGSPSLGLVFFGGEPLLNMDAIRCGVARAEQRARHAGREIRFSVTTNGVLLSPPLVDYFVDHGFKVMVSLDGPAEIHDAVRPLRNGRGSHGIVARNLRAALAGPGRDRCAIRSTFTRQTMELDSIVEYLWATGCRDITVEPCSGPCGQLEIRPEDLPNLKTQYLRLVRRYIDAARQGTAPPFYHFEDFASRAANGGQRRIACGAALSYVAVSADGRIYPCHRLVGMERLVLGDLERGWTRPELREQFVSSCVERRPKCSQCWARYLCGGGCRANSILAGQSMDEPHELDCEMMRSLIEFGTHIYAQVHRPPRWRASGVADCVQR